MELGTLIATSETVEVYKSGKMAIKLFKEGAPKTAALYEALTHARVEATGLPIPIIHEVSVIDNRWAIHMDLIEGGNPGRADEKRSRSHRPILGEYAGYPA